MAAAIEHAHCTTTVDSAVILPEGKAMMSHVKIVQPWEAGSPTQIPTGARGNAPRKGGAERTVFSTSAYIDYFMYDQRVAERIRSDSSHSIGSPRVRYREIVWTPGEKGWNSYSRPEKDH